MQTHPFPRLHAKAPCAVHRMVFGLLSLTVVGAMVPIAAAQSDGSTPSEGWAHVDCDKEHAGALQRAIDRASAAVAAIVRRFLET